MIPFKIKLLTETAKAPTQENEGDLWDIYADDFCDQNLLDTNYLKDEKVNAIQEDKNNIKLFSQGRILVKTGIAIELPKKYKITKSFGTSKGEDFWSYHNETTDEAFIKKTILCAVADIRPRSGLALKHGITVLNTPGTIDNNYRKEIGVILYNAGHEPYTINKGDKIAQMLIRPLFPSKMEIVKNIKDTGRGGYGSTGK